MSVRRARWARTVVSALALPALGVVACSTSPPASVRAVPGSVVSTSTSVASTSTPAAPATTTAPADTTTAGAAGPASGFAATVTPVSASDLGRSWHDGCPVGPDRLRTVKLSYWGFDDRPHDGAVVVDATVADAVISVFHRLYDEHFPIAGMRPIDAFAGDDNASMAADNTSGFNCRAAVAAGPPQWSAHAYGQAVDVNPVENPYIEGGDVLPPAGAPYVNRSQSRPGMAVSGGPLISAFAAAGWSWGGRWSSPDYQHFSATGG
ncbi:MAG TPA: M15 family metallopeptidase [Acidimicrobiales bacterium]|nr:M15 family metallopeptidase [Acidimicrobiales bacterium]